MRWRLLVLVALIATLVSVALWSALVIAFFYSAAVLVRYDWLFLASMLIPIGGAVFAGVFTYRHTSRRRKTQATLAAILSGILAGASYFILATTFPRRFLIPRTYELPHAR